MSIGEVDGVILIGPTTTEGESLLAAMFAVFCLAWVIWMIFGKTHVDENGTPYNPWRKRKR